jgi:hypothetical protein
VKSNEPVCRTNKNDHEQEEDGKLLKVTRKSFQANRERVAIRSEKSGEWRMESFVVLHA